MHKNTAFQKYFEMYYSQVLGYIRKKVGDVHTAEDLTMDVFLVCYGKFESFDPKKASFATWLYVIVNNKLKNYYRDHKINEPLEENTVILDSFEDDILTAQHIHELRNVLADALKTLSETQRKIVVYKYFYHKNSSDIALDVGMTPGNVRVQLMRALKKLRSYFESRNIQLDL